MIIEWRILHPVSSSTYLLLQSAADRCLLYEGIDMPCAVSVCFCDDETIKQYNKQFRHIDRSTDVLSFPTVSYPSGLTACHCNNLIKNEFDDELGACFLGDLIISVPQLIRQAEEYGHSQEREAAYLFVHGICHLMGYDHIDLKDKEIMRKMEEKILSSLSINRNPSLQSDDHVLIDLARKAMENSYSPYSSFPVGAALRCKDGRIFTGCNIENASFGLTNCAERTAVFKAVSEGATEFDTIVIAARSEAWPCGACRQVLNEFAPNIRVIVTWEEQIKENNLRELLPEGFGPYNLQL